MNHFFGPLDLPFYARLNVENHVVDPFVGDSFYVEFFFYGPTSGFGLFIFLLNYGL